MFPSRDILKATDDFLQREDISQAIVSAFPELEDRILPGEGRPFFRIPYPAGGFVTIAKMTRGRVLRWVVAVPDAPEPTIHEPSSLEDYPRLVADALGLERAD